VLPFYHEDTEDTKVSRRADPAEIVMVCFSLQNVIPDQRRIIPCNLRVLRVFVVKKTTDPDPAIGLRDGVSLLCGDSWDCFARGLAMINAGHPPDCCGGYAASQ
jgi:hypothetical protein